MTSNLAKLAASLAIGAFGLLPVNADTVKPVSPTQTKLVSKNKSEKKHHSHKHTHKSRNDNKQVK